MGVNHTKDRNIGAHVLTFNGKDLREFGVHISGDGTFTAPERDVEYVTVPGRDGDLLVDNRRFLNVTVSYSCGITADFDSNFARLKAWLQHDPGYHRLTDSHHPDEYRMASFVTAIKPDMDAYNETGRFSLEFVCKPQRFTLAGDMPVRYYPVEYGSLNASTGGNTAQTGMARLGYIEVSPGSEFSLSAAYKSGSQQKAILAFYTGGKEKLSVSTISAVNRIVSYSGQIPATAAYAQVAWTFGVSGVVIRNAGVETAYDDYGPVIENAELFMSRPRIDIGNGENATIDMNGTRITVSTYRNVTGCNFITIDCDLQDCYNGDRNMNAFVSLYSADGGIAYEYPAFVPGDNAIRTSGYPVATAASPAIDYLEVTPRWWHT